jgi:hypothetical protein
MAITANGVAASVWEHPTALLVVLRRNGKVLLGVKRNRGGCSTHVPERHSLFGLVGLLVTRQEFLLQWRRFVCSERRAQIPASNTVAAYTDESAKRGRRLRKAH